jgi:hypothetical protein
MTVTDNGLFGGNRQWLVQVAPDPALFTGGQGALAVELGFEVTVGELLSASVNASAWPFDLPTNNSPYGAGPDGLNVNTTSDTVFAAFGSNPFNNGNPVPVLTIVTQGAGETTLTWGGYDVPLGGGVVVKGARIAQAGTTYNGYQGSLTLGGTLGDAWDNSSGSGRWSDAINWADNTEPTATSAVTFPVGFPNGDSVITLAAAETAAALTLNDNYTLTGGSLTLPAGATISVAAGKTATINSALNVTTWTKSGNGTLTVPNVHADALTVGAGALVTAPNGGTSVLKALSIAGPPNAPSAKIDLTSSAAIVDYPAAGPNPAVTIREQIISGRGGSGLGKMWNGLGITSSTAASSAINSMSVGYANNATMPLGPQTTFRGQTVDTSTVLMRFTRTADANLDGVVNNDDVTIVGANYAPAFAKPFWALGDFDYNGFVDNDDITLLGAFYNPSAPPIPVPTGALANAATVPEPAALILLAGGLLASGVLFAHRNGGFLRSNACG